jgi:hypothetical protein
MIEIEANNPPRRFYPQTVIDEILRRIALGESVSKICDGAGFPHRVAWHQWVAQDSALADAYLQAIKSGLSARYERKKESV